MDFSRRVFMGASAAFLAASGVTGAETAKPKIQGLDETKSGADESLDWIPYADRKVREGILELRHLVRGRKPLPLAEVACKRLTQEVVHALVRQTGVEGSRQLPELAGLTEVRKGPFGVIRLHVEQVLLTQLGLHALDHGIHQGPLREFVQGGMPAVGF